MTAFEIKQEKYCKQMTSYGVQLTLIRLKAEITDKWLDGRNKESFSVKDCIDIIGRYLYNEEQKCN